MGAREFKVKQDPRWPDAHTRLSRLWEEKHGEMTQEQFGAEYDIGTQGMVWQYLNGYTPLNVEAAAKFAHGLRCTIRDISPEMDRIVRAQLLPAMGMSAWGKALGLALVLSTLLYASPDGARATLHNNYYQPQKLAKSLNSLYNLRTRLREFVLYMISLFRLGFPLAV